MKNESVNDSTKDTLEKKVVKRGDEWCVVHGSGPREGKIIKCFPTKEQALKMHSAIILSQQRRTKKSEMFKKIQAKYLSFAKPYLRMELEFIHRDIEEAEWNDKKLLIDIKCDGLRITAIKKNGKAYVLVDPEGLKKKSPLINERIPIIVKEIEENFPDNTAVDGEFYAAKGDTALHRTGANAILNSKVSAQKLSSFAFLFVFDVLYYENEDKRKSSLSERLKLLSTIKSTKHIRIENVSSKLEPGHSGYIVDGKNRKALDKAINFILSGKHGLQKKIEEGIVIKTLDHPYQIPTNHGWSKCKRWHEIDIIAYDRKLIKGQKAVWNYFLGLRIDKKYYDKLPDKIKIKIDNKYFIKFGKSDNTKLDIKPSLTSVLRIASEEILRYENENYPEAPWYRGYINIALEEIPERDISDSLDILYRLSLLEPQRIPAEELARLKGEKIPKDVMKYVKYIKTLSIEDIEKFLERLRKKLLELDNK